MKILVALSRFPLPADKGDKLRAYYLIRELALRHEVYLLALTEEEPHDEHVKALKSICARVEWVMLTKREKAWNLVRGVFNDKPFQVNYFRSSNFRKAAEKIILSEKIDLCYVQLLRMHENIPHGLPVRYFLDYMDSFSAGMRRRAEISKRLQRMVVNEEYWRLKAYEEKIFPSYDGASVITECDADAFPQHIREKLHIVPNGLDKKFLEDIKTTKDIDIIFTGNLAYHPNVQACLFMVKKVLPLLLQQRPHVKVYLVGRDPVSKIRALESDNVTVTGYVEDIRIYLARARVFAAPLFSGSGLQNKLLEAMGTGVPIVTSPLANRALGAKESKETWVASSAEDFAGKILLLLKYPGLASDLGAHGREFVKQHYSWQKAGAKLERALEGIK